MVKFYYEIRRNGMERNIEKEWVYLMMQAKQMGITIEEIRTFLRERSLAEISYIENKN
jgi:Anti-repressor SinI